MTIGAEPPWSPLAVPLMASSCSCSRDPPLPGRLVQGLRWHPRLQLQPGGERCSRQHLRLHSRWGVWATGAATRLRGDEEPTNELLMSPCSGFGLYSSRTCTCPHRVRHRCNTLRGRVPREREGIFHSAVPRISGLEDLEEDPTRGGSLASCISDYR